MSELSTQLSERRAVVTETSRRDVAAEAVGSANAGQGDGKDLPSMSDSRAAENVQQSETRKEQRVASAVAKLNDYVQSYQRDLTFTVDEDLGRPIVRVIDSTTQEVIRQIPNDVTIRLARNLNVVEAERLAKAYGGSSSSAGAQRASIGLVNTRV